MELTFEKQDNFYVSEFQLTSDANLHIEKSTGKLQLFQRTIGAGDYAEVKDFDTSDYDSDKIIDIDLQSLVYPKWIKIKSAVKPLVATITTDGEVNEVVYQAKDIEITSNGTTKVTADTGYTALGSVNVKVNVPTEGGGDKVVYLDITQAVYPMEGYLGAILTLMPILTVKIPSMKSIRPSSWAVAGGDFEYISACAILPNVRVIDPDNDVNSNDVIEQFKQFGAFEITKEEFYNLNA